MMKNFWTAIGDFFTATFEVMPYIGNKINSTNFFLLNLFYFYLYRKKKLAIQVDLNTY